MRRIFFAYIIIATTFGLGFSRPVFADVSNWHKGVSIYPRGPHDFGSEDMKNLFKRIREDNANYVTFVIPYYQGNYRSTNIFPGIDTPTDESIIQGIKWAHEHDLAVMLKPHLDSGDKAWRANINPMDRDTWYSNYEDMLFRYARIAEQYGAEQLCIGTELISMAAYSMNPDNTQRWRKIISDIRKDYHGELSYSANWGPSTSVFASEKDYIGFWDDLDYIGLSAYFPLATKDNSVPTLVAAWDRWDKTDVEPLAKWGKPIIFTEVGYRSSQNSRIMPYEYQKKGIYDPQEQINAYQAMFEYWHSKPYVGGVSIWNFYSDPYAGGEGNTDFTPQNKPAEQVLKDWFAPPVVVETSNPTEPIRRSLFMDVEELFKSLIKFPLMTTTQLISK